jgi:hypothetical protein
MPERSGREFVDAWVAVVSTADFDRLPELLHPDCVHEYPQSGERFRGIANIRAIFENYPGGFSPGRQDHSSLRVAGGTDRWTMLPNFTVVRTTGAGNSFTSAIKAHYPDGSEWYVISVFELADGLMTRASMFFAPVFEAPEWRRPFAEESVG